MPLPPYRILHQCHQCSSVNRRCNNRPIRGYTGIQKNRRITEEPFFKNVYRRSLALAPTPPPPFPSPRVFPVYYFTRSPLTATLYYLNACNRLRWRGWLCHILHTYIHVLFIWSLIQEIINYFQITNIMNLRLVYPLTKHCFPFVYQVGLIKVSGKLPTYSSPKLTLTLTPHFGQNDGLGEG